MVSLPYPDRRAAGRALADSLRHLAGQDDVTVLGLARGGVPVAAEVASALSAPLDVVVVRKLGLPWQPELAMGAVAAGDVRVLNDQVIALGRVGDEQIAEVTRRERAEVDRRERAYRDGRDPLPLAGRRAVVVDDGLATGASAAAAIRSVRARGGRPILAVPVGAAETVNRLRAEADEVVCAATPEGFMAVGAYYADFGPVPDDDVRELIT